MQLFFFPPIFFSSQKLCYLILMYHTRCALGHQRQRDLSEKIGNTWLCSPRANLLPHHLCPLAGLEGLQQQTRFRSAADLLYWWRSTSYCVFSRSAGETRNLRHGKETCAQRAALRKEKLVVMHECAALHENSIAPENSIAGRNATLHKKPKGRCRKKCINALQYPHTCFCILR